MVYTNQYITIVPRGIKDIIILCFYLFIYDVPMFDCNQ